jgi:hypothetical protein
MSVRLPGSSTPRPPQRNEGTYIAMIFVLAVVGGLIAFVSLILPQASGLILVAGGFCGFVALHYFTWGRWLSRMAAEQKERLLEDEIPRQDDT